MATMVDFRTLVVLAPFMFLSASCSSDGRVIYYYVGCDNAEVYADVGESVSGIAEFSKRNNIKLIEELKGVSFGLFFRSCPFNPLARMVTGQ